MKKTLECVTDFAKELDQINIDNIKFDKKEHDLIKKEKDIDIRIMADSQIYQDRVRKAFSKDNQRDGEERKLREAFFTDRKWVEKDRCYHTKRVSDFDGRID